MAPPTDRHLTRQKVRDRSIVLLVLGVVLILPPVAGISQLDGRIGGIPVPLVYLFTVWAGLIAGTAALARPLGRVESRNPDGEPGDTLTPPSV